jgi:hypothetical protein
MQLVCSDQKTPLTNKVSTRSFRDFLIGGNEWVAICFIESVLNVCDYEFSMPGNMPIGKTYTGITATVINQLN